ncbi:MAG: 16S rRNA (uracil(1498)-N(3))-methyltransferase, partial [Treponemataceae bacterium]|nr:16S rRNA (uracil(1498)-N(3))-methyltransferase [Treponemataceae bacterium]
MNICLFSAEELERPLDARDERAVHLVKILHKKEGDAFAAGVIGGRAGTAVITRLGGGILEYRFTPESDGKPLHPLRMIVGFPRPIQLKRLLRDVAGIGACEIHLTGTELGEKSYMQSSLVERGAARRLLLDGVVQAGGTHVPALFLHRTLPECLAAVRGGAADSGALLLALDNVE